MATHGSLSEYNSAELTSKEWTDVDEAAKKRVIFLSVVGDKTYKLIQGLVAPAKPMDKSYQDLVDLLTSHLQPAPSMIVERFKFNSHF